MIFPQLVLAVALTGAQQPAAKTATPSAAPAPAAAAKKAPLVRPVFENDFVRVVEVVWEPGAETPAIKLPGTDVGVLGVVIKGGAMEHTQAGGTKLTRERKPGEILWEAGSAKVDARRNAGSAPMHMIQIRVKKPPPAKSYSGPAGTVKPSFENKVVAAFDQKLAPKEKLELHKYAPRVWIMLEGGHLRSFDKAGKKQEALVRPNQIMWLEAQEQSIENVGAAPVRYIALELK